MKVFNGGLDWTLPEIGGNILKDISLFLRSEGGMILKRFRIHWEGDADFADNIKYYPQVKGVYLFTFKLVKQVQMFLIQFGGWCSVFFVFMITFAINLDILLAVFFCTIPHSSSSKLPLAVSLTPRQYYVTVEGPSQLNTIHVLSQDFQSP